jgi:cytochrome c oxidase subunit III
MIETLVEEPQVAARTVSRTAADAIAEPEARQPIPSAALALWVVLASVTMLFAGFASAYLVRRASPDWVPVAAPPILGLSTALLLGSSLALEKTKQHKRRAEWASLQNWLLGSLGLGLAFIASQIAAWRQLAGEGIFLPTSPHASFFYMLTAIHGAHVLGGIVLLLFFLPREWRLQAAGRSTGLELAATYWHFVTGIWIFLYLLLFVWR